MGRKLGVPNKITSEIKERLSKVIMDAMSRGIDIDLMTQNEKLKLIQIGLTYVIPRLKQVEEITDEMPTNFQIEIIDRLDKYKDRDLDKAIRK
jgi:hydrogenase maturation factor